MSRYRDAVQSVHTPSPSRHRRAAKTTAALAVLGSLIVGCESSASASGDQANQRHDVVQQRMDRLVRDDAFPAALAAVRGRNGSTRDYTAGVADREDKTKVPADGQVRIGSTTKSFTAVVVLQLVGEGRVSLDAPIETYLPQLVRGDGIDGRHITVRQLLQHTSGLPDYVAAMGGDFFKGRHTYTEPRDLLDLALTEKAKFAPGSKFEYSNTNYLLAGLLIQKVTGRPVAEEITQRVIKPTGLRHAYFPGIGDQDIRRPHPRGYHVPKPGDAMRDITEMDPSWAWAAGQMVATPSDLNRFYSALLGGKLLKPAQLKQMRTTVPASDLWPGARYGLGLISTPLSCGGLVWGHGGDIPGYETRGGATEDGRAVSVTVTALPNALPTDQAGQQTAADHVIDFVDTALCGK
ncbi:serine hydrolase domain-containing protein [Streptomyces antimycoticus]